MASGRPQLIFGGAAIAGGNFVSPEKVLSLLKLLKSSNIHRIDTAPIYPSTSPGKAEQLLGDCNPRNDGFTVDTKIMVTSMTGKGTLKPEAIDQSLSTSLARLRSDINVLYCHMPDPDTPISSTAAALDCHHRKSHFAQLGLSNFSAQQVEDYIDVCVKEGYVKPSYYQGQYNAVCRNHEKSLLPLLRKHDMHYVAYSPLAGGFLSGIFTQGTNVSGTRFEEGNQAGAFYKRMYDKEPMHCAIRQLQKGCEGHALKLTDAALRWLYHHSVLATGDGVILGASKEDQVRQNVDAMSKGPLPDDLLELFEQMWKEVESEAP